MAAHIIKSNGLRLPAVALVAGWLCLAAGIHAQDWPAAARLLPNQQPTPLTFSFPGGGPLARSTPDQDRWYSVSYLPVVPGTQYTVLLCCGAATNASRLYALDRPPPQIPGMKVPLSLSSVQLAVDGNGRSAHGAVATFQLPLNAALPQLFLLIESPPMVTADESPNVSVEVYGGVSGYPVQRVHGGWWFAGGGLGAVPSHGRAVGGLSRGRPQLLPTPAIHAGVGR